MRCVFFGEIADSRGIGRRPRALIRHHPFFGQGVFPLVAPVGPGLVKNWLAHHPPTGATATPFGALPLYQQAPNVGVGCLLRALHTLSPPSGVPIGAA